MLVLRRFGNKKIKKKVCWYREGVLGALKWEEVLVLIPR